MFNVQFVRILQNRSNNTIAKCSQNSKDIKKAAFTESGFIYMSARLFELLVIVFE